MHKSRGETCRTKIFPEQNYVVKQFTARKPKFGLPVNRLRGSLDLCFYREVECLDRLRGCEHFPQIIEQNSKERWIKMSYVGENYEKADVRDHQLYHKQIDKIVDTLISKKIKLAYEWAPNDGKIGYCLSMMMFKDNVLSLIDFERAWPVGCDRESEFNSIFKTSFAHHDDEKFKDILKITISKLHEHKKK